MSRYTEKLIMQTFNEMLTEMPFDKITVSALTRRSDISHNTFYYHYKDIYHLLTVWIRQEITPYLQVGELYPDREHAICALLHKWQDEERRIYHVFHSLSREQMERYVYEQAEKYFFEQVRAIPEAEPLDDSRVRQISSFACFMFLGFLMRFLWNRMQDDVEKSVHELSILLENFLRHAIRDARAGAL